MSRVYKVKNFRTIQTKDKDKKDKKQKIKIVRL